MVTQQDIFKINTALYEAKNKFATERGWTLAGEMHDMWVKHLPAGKIYVDLDAVIEIERCRDAQAAKNMAAFAQQLTKDEQTSSEKTVAIANEILQQPAMQKRFRESKLTNDQIRSALDVAEQVIDHSPSLSEQLSRSTGADHSSQRPPTNPPDGENPRADVWRLANLGHKYRDKMAVALHIGGVARDVYAVEKVIHCVNDESVLIVVKPIDEVDRGDAKQG